MKAPLRITIDTPHRTGTPHREFDRRTGVGGGVLGRSEMANAAGFVHLARR